MKKPIEEYNRFRGLISALFIEASRPDVRLINIEEFALSEFANGVISYLGGEAGKVTYSPGIRLETGQFERMLLDNMALELKKSKISPELKRSIEELTAHRVEAGYFPNDAESWCRFYDYYNGGLVGIIGNQLCSIVDITCTTMKEARSFLKGTSEKERKEVKGIGAAMRPYLKKDLEYISSNYRR